MDNLPAAVFFGIMVAFIILPEEAGQWAAKAVKAYHIEMQEGGTVSPPKGE